MTTTRVQPLSDGERLVCERAVGIGVSLLKQVIAILAGAFLLGWTPNVSAQSGIPTRELSGATSTLSGTVVSSITTALVLRDSGGSEHTFLVDSTSALPAGLVPGMRVNVKFEVLKGGLAHLISVGTSYAMNVGEADGQPQENSPVALRPRASARPPALSTFGLGDSANSPNTEPAKGETRPPGSRTLPNVLVTATLSLGAAIALWWARRAF